MKRGGPLIVGAGAAAATVALRALRAQRAGNAAEREAAREGRRERPLLTGPTVLEAYVHDLVNSSEYKQIAAIAIREMLRLFGCDAARIHTAAAVRDGTDTLLVKAARVDAVRWEHHAGRAHTPPGVVRMAGREQIERAVPEFRVAAVRPRSAVMLPLTARGNDVGSVTLAWEYQRVFTDDDEAFARTLTALASGALDRARLFELERLTAETLQEALLPAALPAIDEFDIASGFRSADGVRAVGGDFYDIVQCRDGHVVMLGDVCGKGANAATIAAVARHAARALARHADTPADLLREVNRVLVEHAPDSSRFVTAVCCKLAERDGVTDVQVASAGHLPVIALREDGTSDVNADTGQVLGIDPVVEIGEWRTSLNRHDSLIVFTDGVTDARAPQIMLSVDDLRAALRQHAAKAPSVIVDEITRLAVGDADPRDDIALIVARRRSDDVTLDRRYETGASDLRSIRVDVIDAITSRFALSDRQATDVRLAVGEAVANVVMHAYDPGEIGQIHVRVVAADHQAQVIVRDWGRGMQPRPDSPGLGFGMNIMRELASDVHARRLPRGTEVALTFALPSAPQGSLDDPQGR